MSEISKTAFAGAIRESGFKKIGDKLADFARCNIMVSL